MYEMPLQLIT